MTNFADNQVPLTQMRAGQSGQILKIIGGRCLVHKLESLGIREGVEVKKISRQWLRGPILLQYGCSQVALGFGMASKVLVNIVVDL